jgi:ferredoxin
MIDKVKEKVKELLDAGDIKGFLGLRQQHGHVGPHLFCTSDELDSLVLGDGDAPGDSRYPLNKLLINLVRHYPDETFGLLVRGCDQRCLKTLATWNQINPGKVKYVGIACPAELAQACECRTPYPEEFVAGDPVEGVAYESVNRIDGLDLGDRFDEWQKEFGKCVKCYGCRDICPVCFCKECSLETDELIRTGDIPPENPLFHLTRAVHMAGRCIDCGLCSEACPADIPLRTLYKKVADITDQEFKYRPGYVERKSPLNILTHVPDEE